MSEILFRCSSLGAIMTEPVSVGDEFRTPEVEAILAKKKRTDEEASIIALAKQKTLSAGAKTFIRRLVAQELFGVDFEVSSKQMEKGIECEPQAIALLNRVRGLSLTKNTERKSNGLITGEADLFGSRRGHDTKVSWSVATFPIAEIDCRDALYEWQMRGYMMLWGADVWEVNYCLLNTPERLIGYEPVSMHFVDHIPEHMRLTTWSVTRDAEKEALIETKVKAARAYYIEVAAEFDRSHQPIRTLAETVRSGSVEEVLAHGAAVAAEARKQGE